mgnify:CR=1 FL=1
MCPLEHLADRSPELMEVVAWVTKSAPDTLLPKDLAHGLRCVQPEFTDIQNTILLLRIFPVWHVLNP